MIKQIIFINTPVFYYTESTAKRNCAGNQAEKKNTKNIQYLPPKTEDILCLVLTAMILSCPDIQVTNGLRDKIGS